MGCMPVVAGVLQPAMTACARGQHIQPNAHVMTYACNQETDLPQLHCTHNNYQHRQTSRTTRQGSARKPPT
eukprot:3371125-Amphidinium_carterae.1